MAETPLLRNANGVTNTTENKDYLEVKSFKEAKSIFWSETVKLWNIGGPIVFALLCQYGVNSITGIFVGHIGAVQLSAVSLSLSVINVFTFGFLLGMGSALETLCGQAVGAGQLHMLGIYLQRSCIILSAACVIMTPIYVFSGPILKLLGQDEEIAELCGYFTILTTPQMYSLAFYFPVQKFLQSQSNVNVPAWIALGGLVLHVPMLWLFLFQFGWGITGAAIAFDITNWFVAIAQIVYVVGWCTEGWKGFSLLAFKDIWAFVRLSLASAVMLCLEIWYMMSIMLVTGHLSNAVIAVGSLAICMNINGWENIMFIGVNAAISVRVSNEVGSGHPRAAKYSVYVTLFQSFLIGVLFMVIILVAKDYFAVLFTNSKELQVATAKLAYLLAITMVVNSVQPVICGGHLSDWIGL